LFISVRKKIFNNDVRASFLSNCGRVYGRGGSGSKGGMRNWSGWGSMWKSDGLVIRIRNDR